MRNSKAAVYAWRTKMDMEKIQKIQNSCKNVMGNLGYKFIEDVERKEDTNFAILAKSKEEVEQSLAEL